jgi:two-component system sensor histidine kinase YesM
MKEFDLILRHFNSMRSKINELMDDIREKEKRKARLEVDKLLLQINPHFIHNTLDTVRWMARINGNDEIDRFISTLNRLIYYNLGKGETASIRDEVEALKDYTELQRIRYNFQFDVRIDVEDALLDFHVPRFMLQPLVENALYHGGGDDGIIKVEVGKQEESHIVIRVIDNGEGISDISIRQLLSESAEGKKKAGLGIGVQYVIGMLQYQYGDAAQFRIESGSGKGTAIILSLPITRKEDDEHERTAR